MRIPLAILIFVLLFVSHFPVSVRGQDSGIRIDNANSVVDLSTVKFTDLDRFTINLSERIVIQYANTTRHLQYSRFNFLAMGDEPLPTKRIIIQWANTSRRENLMKPVFLPSSISTPITENSDLPQSQNSITSTPEMLEQPTMSVVTPPPSVLTPSKELPEALEGTVKSVTNDNEIGGSEEGWIDKWTNLNRWAQIAAIVSCFVGIAGVGLTWLTVIQARHNRRPD